MYWRRERILRFMYTAVPASLKGLQGKELVDIALLYSKGAAGFTDDGIPLLDVDILEQAFVKAASIGVPVSLHEEESGADQ